MINKKKSHQNNKKIKMIVNIKIFYPKCKKIYVFIVYMINLFLLIS